ncbi:MAG TPA: peptidylprolyl isomerase [Phenylobacterium sp.]|nr:peptidylprolyl isomerase [Phenylobacterium sp.]
MAQTPPPAPPAQAAPPAGLAEAVAAVVNDDIISTYDLAQRMRLLIATSGVQPTQENLPQFQREALVSLVDERLQYQELRRVEKEQKIDLLATDEEVDQELGEMAKANNVNREQFVSQLAAQGIGAETLRSQIRAQTSWQRWIRGRYGSRLRIGEDQIKAQQQRVAASASKPQFQISEVFIDANRVGGMQTAINGASQLISQMQQGAPFPAVARQFSASATAASGGEVGWIAAGEMAPEVDAALEQMRPGQLSKPIPVRDGVYIIYLRDKRSGAGATVVNLKQAAVGLTQTASAADVEAARVKLATLRGQIKGCDDLEAQAAKIPGVLAADLGEAEIKDLAPAFREAAERLQPGEVSDPIRTNAGLHLVAVCGKRATGEQVAGHDQIENRLYGQQLSMIARRYMRDLRNSATIETR